MVNDVIGIINDARMDYNMKEIGYGRTMASIPFGGRYRMVDFTLSNMINSGIKNVGILVQGNSRSLIGHVRSPKEWDLDRKRDGLFILPPGNDYYANAKVGDLQILYNNLDYIKRSKQQYVLISGVNIICNIDFSEVIDFHRKNGNDITVLYKDVKEDINKFDSCTTIELNSQGEVTDMAVNPAERKGTIISMGMFIMSKELIVHITKECVARGETDLIKNGTIKNLGKLKVYGYEYKGYLANVDCIQDYYRHNMELLKGDVWKEIFFKAGRIYTKAMDQAPAKYAETASVHNSLVANGCTVGGTLEGSILFRKVKIHKGAIVRNSIIMQNCEIEEGAVLENVIVDKDCRITKGKHLSGSEAYPLIIQKKSVV